MTKVLISSLPDGNASQYSLGILNALNELGHQAAFWNRSNKSAFDAFAEFQPDVLFLESVHLVERAIGKCIAKHNTKIVVGLEEYLSSAMDVHALAVKNLPPDQTVTFIKVHGPEVPDT